MFICVYLHVYTSMFRAWQRLCNVFFFRKRKRACELNFVIFVDISGVQIGTLLKYVGLSTTCACERVRSNTRHEFKLPT